MLPLSDRNAWYYPSLGHDSDEEDLSVGHPEGNWGHKNTKSARWVRRGKINPWGPEMEDWEVRALSACSRTCYNSSPGGGTRSKTDQAPPTTRAQVTLPTHLAASRAYTIPSASFPLSGSKPPPHELRIIRVGQIYNAHLPLKFAG